MTAYQQQHYVQKAYLKRFTYDGSRTWVYDKSSGQSFRANVRNVATERGFYDLPDEVEAEACGPHTIERLFQLVEADFDVGVNRVLKEHRVAAEAKYLLAPGIVFQLIRTKGARVKFLDRWTDDYPDGPPIEEVGEPLAHYLNMMGVDEVNGLIFSLPQRIWTLAIPDGSQALITSDNPVMQITLDDGVDRIGTTAFGWTEFHLALPLTPTVMLQIFHPRACRWIGEGPQPVDLTDLDGAEVALHDDQVAEYNRIQLGEAHRWVYSSTRESLLSLRGYE